MTITAIPSLNTLIESLKTRAINTGTRQMLGIAGCPGTGKSTFAQHLLGELGTDQCVIVPMDGFHLANELIDGTPLQRRKGAIDTFDIGGYLSLLGRLKQRDETVVYAPTYRRGLEEPIAASIAIPQSVSFVITEGNYLLADKSPWNLVRSYLDETWFIDTPQDIRIARLIARHERFGMSPEGAAQWAHGADEANARYIETTKHLADHVLTWL